MLREVASEPSFTGWAEAWISWRNIKGKGSGKCEDAGVGPQTHPARMGAPSEALKRARPRSPSLVSSWETEAQRDGGLICHCPSSRESCGPCSLGALARLLFSGPARDAGRMRCGYVGAKAGLWGCTGPPPPGRRKLHGVSVAGPGISHPRTSSSSLGRYSCHSGTNTLTYHGQGQGAQTQ